LTRTNEDGYEAANGDGYEAANEAGKDAAANEDGYETTKGETDIDGYETAKRETDIGIETKSTKTDDAEDKSVETAGVDDNPPANTIGTGIVCMNNDNTAGSDCQNNTSMRTEILSCLSNEPTSAGFVLCITAGVDGEEITAVSALHYMCSDYQPSKPTKDNKDDFPCRISDNGAPTTGVDDTRNTQDEGDDGDHKNVNVDDDLSDVALPPDGDVKDDGQNAESDSPDGANGELLPNGDVKDGGPDATTICSYLDKQLHNRNHVQEGQHNNGKETTGNEPNEDEALIDANEDKGPTDADETPVMDHDSIANTGVGKTDPTGTTGLYEVGEADPTGTTGVCHGSHSISGNASVNINAS
jgi:hypothetical protein